MATLHLDVLADLGPRLVTGELAEGATITLEWLAAEYGVSRTVAREVTQVLVSMRLVESRRRTGIRVLPRTDWDVYDPAVIRWRLAGEQRAAHLRELAQLRGAVEPAAAELAATRAPDDVRRQLVALAGDLETSGEAGDLPAFLEHDVAFHRLLLEASGNTMFAALADVVEEVLRGRTGHHLMPPTPKPEARDRHTDVAQAVAAGDAALARAAMTEICLEVATSMADLTTD
jgi:DNA-binding FadR family transcriptional regulator